MKVDFKQRARVFRVGPNREIEIKDWGKILLLADEQVTFVTENAAEYDIVRKSWGFYATPSTNDRLVHHGFASVLVKSLEDKFYIFLIEKGHERAFQEYIAHEGHVVVVWLDGRETDLAKLNALIPNARRLRCLCGSELLALVHTFHAPSPAEVRFSFAQGAAYERRLFQCKACQHFMSIHEMDDGELYSGEYVTSNYGDELKKTFDRINRLPTDKSDNVGRVQAVASFAKSWFAMHSGPELPHILDVGSGLCVFLNRVKNELGWACTAIEPDPRACEHARSVVGIDVIQGDFVRTGMNQQFDVVTLNKVIEHVKDPVAMLDRAKAAVQPAGFIYLEVPDGEKAILDVDGPLREEFTIDHPHVFSAASLSIAVKKAGLSIRMMERLREPSGKYTLRAFVTP